MTEVLESQHKPEHCNGSAIAVPDSTTGHRPEAKISNSAKQRLRVSFVGGTQAGGDGLTFNQDLITVGRGAECDIVLEGETISRQHCLISRCGMGYALQDSSRNGTFVNNARAERSTLQDGDHIKIGPHLMQISFATAVATTQAFAGKKTRPHADTSPCIVVTGGRAEGPQSFTEELITIGRLDENHVAIDADNISRRHLAIERRAAGYFTRDLGSSNGTFLNERKIDAARLQEGDRLRIGALLITVHLRDGNCLLQITPSLQ